MNLSLDYSAIEGSHELKKGILRLYQSGDDEEITVAMVVSMPMNLF